MGRMRAAGAMLTLATVLASSGAPAATPAAPEQPAASFRDGEVLVKFRAAASPAARGAALHAISGVVTRTLPHIGWSRVRIPVGAPVEHAVAVLRSSRAVAAASPNFLGSIALSPNDTCMVGCQSAGRLWNVNAVNAKLGWDVAPGVFYTADEKRALQPVKVAVLDTKIDLSHPDWVNAPPTASTNGHDARLGGQIDVAGGKDLISNANFSGPNVYHGTFVAGILGASANNAAYITGLAYRAQVVPVTVVDGNGTADAAALAEGLLHAHAVGARVANLSLGLFHDAPAVQDAINYVSSKGVLVVAAAGNNSNDQPFYPAWYDNVMAVSALDEKDRRGSCTNFGRHISVSAPGVGITSIHSTRAEKLWVAPCGTSTAAPHVSALAALLFAQNPNRTPSEVRTIIERTADDDQFFPGYDVYYGAGRINFQKALMDGMSGPRVGEVRGTTPVNTGGASLITAYAALPSGTVASAEYAIGEPENWRPMDAEDGAFSSPVERVRAVVDVPKDVPSGVYRIFVRASDGIDTGPASVGVLLIDRAPPSITNLTASVVGASTPFTPVRISFKASDDYGFNVTYSFRVTSKIPGTGMSYASGTFSSVVGNISVDWVPDTFMAGPHDITVTVYDEALNKGVAMTSTVVL